MPPLEITPYNDSSSIRLSHYLPEEDDQELTSSSSSISELFFEIMFCSSLATSTTNKIQRRSSLDHTVSIDFTKAPPMELKNESTATSSTPALARSLYVRSKLAEWLPIHLRYSKLELMYSTAHDGRCLKSLYNKVESSRHTIMLLEPMSGAGPSNKQLVGMYASTSWHESNKVYGDGMCFLFRIDEENPELTQCWHWNPPLLSRIDDDDDDDSTISGNSLALYEQFQVSTDNFLAMGGSEDASNGLRLNQDLTRAASSSALGFANDPLAGKLFDVGLVEVYEITSHY